MPRGDAASAPSSVQDPPGRGLTPRAFQGLLRRLAEDPEAAAAEYEATRRRLTLFFELRGGSWPDGLADETLDRVARKLDEGERVGNLRGYFYGVAKLVLLESQSDAARERAALETARGLAAPDVHAEERQSRIDCLTRCLRSLPQESREFILAYYEAGRAPFEDARKALAARLGLSYANLKIRAHRIRGRLAACLKECLKGLQVPGPR